MKKEKRNIYNFIQKTKDLENDFLKLNKEYDKIYNDNFKKIINNLIFENKIIIEGKTPIKKRDLYSEYFNEYHIKINTNGIDFLLITKIVNDYLQYLQNIIDLDLLYLQNIIEDPKGFFEYQYNENKDYIKKEKENFKNKKYLYKYNLDYTQFIKYDEEHILYIAKLAYNRLKNEDIYDTGYPILNYPEKYESLSDNITLNRFINSFLHFSYINFNKENNTEFIRIIGKENLEFKTDIKDFLENKEKFKTFLLKRKMNIKQINLGTVYIKFIERTRLRLNAIKINKRKAIKSNNKGLIQDINKTIKLLEIEYDTILKKMEKKNGIINKDPVYTIQKRNGNDIEKAVINHIITKYNFEENEKEILENKSFILNETFID